MRLKQKIIRDVIYYLIKICLFFVRILPYKFLSDFGATLSKFVFRFFKKDEELVISNLKIAFPEKSKEEIDLIKNEFYEHIGRCFFEFLKSAYLNDKDFKDLFVDVRGLENIKQAIEEDKGVILLSAHIGNWEIMGAYLASLGFPVNVVATKIYDERLNEILLKHRQKRGVKTLMRMASTKEMIKVLQNKECLGILIDQNTNVKGEFVEFFGTKAYTPTGAALLAMKYDVVVLPVFANRIGKYKHTIEIGEPVEICKDVIKNTQRFNEIIEQRIRKFPAQWVWMHKRWEIKKD